MPVTRFVQREPTPCRPGLAASPYGLFNCDTEYPKDTQTASLPAYRSIGERRVRDDDVIRSGGADGGLSTRVRLSRSTSGPDRVVLRLTAVFLA